jgi:phospholipid/cholesterol/gamma-HCH transport system substrate-binding protein
LIDLNNTYSVYFNDISGLSKKSDVKIAGVKVGWVDSVDLINDGQQVKATLMLDKKYTLFSDAHAVVRQEGLLGSKYLELNPGDPLLPVLPSGSMLTRPSSGPVVVDELMRQFKGIAANIESVTDSMRGAMGGAAGEEKLKLLITDLQQAAQKFASFAGAVDRIAVRNEGNIDDIMSDLRTVMQDLKNEIPRLSQNLQQNFERISATLDRDFARVANQFEKVTSPIQDVASKINEGRGILGQFVNDDDAYQDLRVAVSGIKKYFDKMDKIAVIVDVHTESMYGPFQKYCFKDSRGYFNIRVHPSEDAFWVAGMVAAQAGYLTRIEEHRQWYTGKCDGLGKPLIPCEMHLSDNNKLRFAPVRRRETRRYDSMLYNFQMGKIFGNFALRLGIFESTGGIALDVDVPLGTDKMRWVSTMEFFDLRGRLRMCDDRPHLKWLNRLFFTQNLYFTFGADDFISRNNKNAFFGLGIRFADDDIKYLMTRISLII